MKDIHSGRVKRTPYTVGFEWLEAEQEFHLSK